MFRFFPFWSPKVLLTFHCIDYWWLVLNNPFWNQSLLQHPRAKHCVWDLLNKGYNCDDLLFSVREHKRERGHRLLQNVESWPGFSLPPASLLEMPPYSSAGSHPDKWLAARSPKTPHVTYEFSCHWDWGIKAAGGSSFAACNARHLYRAGMTQPVALVQQEIARLVVGCHFISNVWQMGLLIS